MLLAVSGYYESFWWLSIALGVVVLGVVIILLSLLISLVKDIDENVAVLWTTATAMAANTATTWQLDQAAEAAGRLRAELELQTR